MAYAAKNLKYDFHHKKVDKPNSKETQDLFLESGRGDSYRRVAQTLAECKEHIAAIIVQILTLHYDYHFCDLYPSFCYKNLSLSSPEVEK